MEMDGASRIAAEAVGSDGVAAAEHFDVLLVGAGLSGIGAAWHLQSRAPSRSYVILESREAIGGTWDLFRYPGIRSDSDMYTLGFAFKPWLEAKAIADGPSILNYLRETAREHGIERNIRFRHHVKSASWSSETALWTIEAERSDSAEAVRYTCRWLHMCSGYYDYAGGYLPAFEDMDRFAGRIVHPQFWPEDLDYRGRKVVVIGSGATAVTLVPAMALTAGHVVMLQRSPTYVVSRPAEDGIANWLRRRLPAMLAYRLVRWKNVLLQQYFFRLARKRPDKVRAKLLELVREELGPDYDVETHFTPRYNPWQQRLCLVPDSDLFEAIRQGKASVVTGEIERFTQTGVKLKSGAELEADIIVSATGLKLQLLSDVAISIDGVPRDMSKTMTYKGMMFSDVPNLSYSFGYTNASWTLKADLTSGYLCRILNHLQANGFDIAIPRRDPEVGEMPFIDFTSGYFERARDLLPKQGTKKPWKLHQNYALDMAALKYGAIDDGTIRFRRCPQPARPLATAAA
jgi:cation diffusion facilitator CzcD-associated flavoprotein CzcO